MPTYTSLPNGQVVAIPDDATPSELAELQLHANSQQKQIDDAKPSMLGQAGHAVGLTARALATGALSLPAMGADAIATTSNKLLGTHFPNQSELIQQTMTRLGLPEPNGMADQATMLIGSVAGGSAWNKPINAAVKGITGAATPLYNAPTATTPRMQALQEGQQAGYKVLPAEVAQAGGGQGVSNALESVGGRSTAQSMAKSANENVTNALARKAAGLAPDAPLTKESLQNAISDTYQQGYAPVASIGKIPAMPSYHQALDDIGKNMQGMSRSFPDAAKTDIADLVDSYRVPQMDAGDAIQAVSQLRDQASTAFAKGNAVLGRASRAIAKSLEDNIEDYLGSVSKGQTLNGNVQNGTLNTETKQLLDNFREARTQLAKQYTVQNALKEGTGNINAAKIGSLFDKKPGYLTDELRTIGAFANAAPRLVGQASPQSTFTKPEVASMLGSGIASHFGTGGISSIVGALPVARAALRYGLMSPMGQNMLMPGTESGPSMIPGMLPGLMAGGQQLGSGLYGLMGGG